MKTQTANRQIATPLNSDFTRIPVGLNLPMLIENIAVALLSGFSPILPPAVLA